MAAQFLGKWKMDNDATENIDGFAEAMKFPTELTEKIKSERDIVVDMSCEGDTYTAITDHGDRKVTYVFKLGEKFTTKDYDIESENIFTTEGDAFVGKHTFMGTTTTSRRTLKDGKMIIEMEGNGATMKNVFIKC